ncbi:MAG: sigma-70 family RNA polymerase sigma factor [Bryobacteraceae bacterium]|nr:sigma-70 family RNA polymerase sigma factor [Bryobacteraceae bacterium]
MLPDEKRFGPVEEEAPAEWPGFGDEERLLEGLREGDDAAYEALLERFQTPVYQLVCRLLDDPNEAGDVVQDVFLKVFRGVGSFRGQSSLKTWIYRIAVNEAHNRRRWFSRHRKPEVVLGGEEEGSDRLDRLSDHGRTPYDWTLNNEMRSAIEEALEGINPVFRSAVVLRDLEELSYEEIADILDVSIGTVKSRILRGREALRRALVEKLEPARGLAWSPQTASD